MFLLPAQVRLNELPCDAPDKCLLCHQFASLSLGNSFELEQGCDLVYMTIKTLSVQLHSCPSVRGGTGLIVLLLMAGKALEDEKQSSFWLVAAHVGKEFQ